MKRIFLFSGLCVLLMAGIITAGCSDSDSSSSVPPPDNTMVITGISIPEISEAVPGSEITIGGRGFAKGDKLHLQSRSASDVAFTVGDPTVTDDGIMFRLPDGIRSGDYTISVERGDRRMELGTISLNIVVQTDIPDKQGMNVKGFISCKGNPLAGVSVSDGIQVVQTDADGIYYLNSDKKNGYVFISLPSGYEVPVNKAIPQFFKRLTRPAAEVERLDFVLTSAPNDKHTMIVFTDTHLARRNDDRETFRNGFLSEIERMLMEAAPDEKIYCLALGDLAWDQFWYAQSYDLTHYRTEIANLDCAIFSVPGNHDNDPYIANNDFLSGRMFREAIGPNYFSFNIGKVHYIMLDNVEYINTGASQGVIGQRNYNRTIVDEELKWLQQDLATLCDKNMPIVVGMHVPLYKAPAADAESSYTPTRNLDNADELIASFDGFTNVSFLSGHTHVNYNNIDGGSIREHNIAAVCATWWWTSKSSYDAHNEICKDGSPGGYKVFEMDGTKARWYYKGTGKERDYQFRTYDLNRVLITTDRYCPDTSVPDAAAKACHGYDAPNTKNEVLINIWDWDPSWTLSVKELPEGRMLTPVRVSAYDPLHIISYNMQRFKYGATSLSFATSVTSHMFKVTASSPETTLEITATNGDGVKYMQTMMRPKDFDFQMK